MELGDFHPFFFMYGVGWIIQLIETTTFNIVDVSGAKYINFPQEHILPQRKRRMRLCFRCFFWRGSLKFHTKNCHKRDNKWDVQDVWPSDFVCIICILDILEPPMNTWITIEHNPFLGFVELVIFVTFFTQANHPSSHHFFYFFPSIVNKQIQAITTRFVVSSRLFVAKFYTKLLGGMLQKFSRA